VRDEIKLCVVEHHTRASKNIFFFIYLFIYFLLLSYNYYLIILKSCYMCRTHTLRVENTLLRVDITFLNNKQTNNYAGRQSFERLFYAYYRSVTSLLTRQVFAIILNESFRTTKNVLIEYFHKMASTIFFTENHNIRGELQFFSPEYLNSQPLEYKTRVQRDRGSFFFGVK
jgi:hypothetical protein